MTSDQQHEELAQRIIKDSDEKAFAAFYNEYRQRLLYFTNRLVHDVIEAEDIVNVTFQKLWLLRQNFTTLADICSFMYVTANNAGLNYLKYNYKGGAQRKQEILTPDIELLPLREDRNAEFIYGFLDAETYARVYEEIGKLPPRQRKIIEMVLDEKTYEEIAQTLNIEEPVIFSRMPIESTSSHPLLTKAL